MFGKIRSNNVAGLHTRTHTLVAAWMSFLSLVLFRSNSCCVVSRVALLHLPPFRPLSLPACIWLSLLPISAEGAEESYETLKELWVLLGVSCCRKAARLVLGKNVAANPHLKY